MTNVRGICRDLAKFIAADRIPCTIDRVNGVIETNRPDDKNKQYADVVKQGDALITKLQKYGQAVRLRGVREHRKPGTRIALLDAGVIDGRT